MIKDHTENFEYFQAVKKPQYFNLKNVNTLEFHESDSLLTFGIIARDLII